MDLSKYSRTRARQGVPMRVKGPDGVEWTDEASGEPVTITLLGADSDQFQELRHRIQTARLRRGLSRGKAQQLSSADLEKEALDLLVECTVAWSHIREGGKELDCKPDIVRAVYTEYPFLREQVDEFVNDRSNFLGN